MSATTAITYADVNEDVLRTLIRPKPAYFLLVIGFATAFLIGAIKLRAEGRKIERGGLRDPVQDEKDPEGKNTERP